MRRIVVVGACGSGKSTLSQALARRLGIPLVELDALQHGPGWTPRPTFAEDVDAATRGPAWIVDGNYASVRELLWSRADAVIWLDLPRPLVLWQVVRRSFIRWVGGAELWNGNRERGPRSWLDPEHPIRWSWKKHPYYREFYGERFAAAEISSPRAVSGRPASSGSYSRSRTWGYTLGRSPRFSSSCWSFSFVATASVSQPTRHISWTWYGRCGCSSSTRRLRRGKGLTPRAGFRISAISQSSMIRR